MLPLMLNTIFTLLHFLEFKPIDIGGFFKLSIHSGIVIGLALYYVEKNQIAGVK